MATGQVRIWEGAGGPWGRQRDRGEGRGTAGKAWLLGEPHVATAKNRVVGQAGLVEVYKLKSCLRRTAEVIRYYPLTVRQQQQFPFNDHSYSRLYSWKFSDICTHNFICRIIP